MGVDEKWQERRYFAPVPRQAPSVVRGLTAHGLKTLI
jgi:hypothetical protein